MDEAWQALLAALEEQMAHQCNALFCVLDPHDDDRHVDATGYGWNAPTPASPVLAHVYTFPEES